MSTRLGLYLYVDGVNDTPFPSSGKGQACLIDWQYSAKRMGGAPTITGGTIYYPSCLDSVWQDNVYVMYNGERYFPRHAPTSSYSNTTCVFKHNVDFVSERFMLDNIYFYDVVPQSQSDDASKPISNNATFTFSGTLKEFVARLNVALGQRGGTPYTCVIDDVDSEAANAQRQIKFDKKFISEAMQESFKIWGVPYYFAGTVIHYGDANPSAIDNIVFEYGHDKSLLAITKTNAGTRVINRITGVGSKDNIPYYYPNSCEEGVVGVADLSSSTITAINVLDDTRFAKLIARGDTLTYKTAQNYHFSIPSYYINDELCENGTGFRDAPNTLINFTIPFDVKCNGTTNASIRIYIGNQREFLFASGPAISPTPSGNVNVSIDGNYIIVNVSAISKGKYQLTLGYIVSDYISKIGACQMEVTSTGIAPAWKSEDTGEVYQDLTEIGLQVVGSPANNDSFKQDILGVVIPQENLMPPIYRSSNGSERFYNAINNTYINPDTGQYYTFPKPFTTQAKAKEYIETLTDIKPSISGIVNAQNVPIDRVIKFAFDENDNDEVDENNKLIHPYFYALLPKMDGLYGFNLFDKAIEEDEMSLSFTTGNLGGCEFKIGVGEQTMQNLVQILVDSETKQPIYDQDGHPQLVRDTNGNVKIGNVGQDWQNDTMNNEVWVALLKEDSTYGILMPNVANNYMPSNEDDNTYVILHIDLPSAYIRAAENALKEALIGYMYEANNEHYNFTIDFSRIYLQENPEVLAALNENCMLKIRYNGNVYERYVSGFSYKTSANELLPAISVELAETLSASSNPLDRAIDGVKDEISKINSQRLDYSSVARLARLALPQSSVENVGSEYEPIYFDGTKAKKVIGIDLPESLHTQKNVEAEGGVVARGIGGMHMGGGGGNGTLTEIQINGTRIPDASGVVNLPLAVGGNNGNDGAMSSADKDKLDGIAEHANNYVLPIASAGTLGGVRVGAGLSINASGVLSATYSLPLAANGTRGGVQIGYQSNGRNYAVELDGEKMFVNVPWTDTTYESKAASQGGTAVSLVTTGEKYTWNAKQDAISDLSTIRTQAGEGHTAYNYFSGGILPISAGGTGASSASVARTNLGLGAAATYGVGSVAASNTGLVTGGDVYSAINSALTAAMKIEGETTTQISDGSTTNPIVIGGQSVSAYKGMVVFYGSKEFVWVGTSWKELGDESSFAIKTTTITGTGYLSGGGDLSASRTIDIAQTIKDKIDTSYANNHTHSNKSILDGIAGTAGTTYNLDTITSNISTLQGYFNNGSANTAVQLLNTRTIWGQNFNGTANVSGAMSGVTNIDTLLYFDTTNARLGVEVSNPSDKFHVGGNIIANGGVAAKGIASMSMGGTGGGGTLTQIKVNNVALADVDGVVNIPLATTSADGAMSSSDKSKLDGIAEHANNYTLPAATSGALGGIRLGYSASGKNYPVQLDGSNKAYVNVPWENTTYESKAASQGGTAVSLVTTGEKYIWNNKGTYSKPSGGIPASDLAESYYLASNPNGYTKTEASTTNGKIKINGTDTTVYTHPTTAGNKHIPSGGSSGQFLGWSADGTAAWVNNPNTDSKVYQQVTGTSNTSWRPLIVGASWNDAETFAPSSVTDQVYASHLAKFAPSTGLFAIVGLRQMGTDAKLVAGSTNKVFNTNGGVSMLYDWAQASSKPSYAFSEITGTASTSQIPTLAISKISGLQTALDGKLATSLKGAANGLAELDANGLVPSSQLPSYVDDVLEYASKSAFPATGTSGKIYVALDTNLTYRWSGTAYVEISPSLALGETSSTAYRGDRGKTAYDHATETKSGAQNSGFYKFSVTAQGHISGVSAVAASDLTTLIGSTTYAPYNSNGYLPLNGGIMTGAIKRKYSDASDDPVINVASVDKDIWIWRVSDSDYATSAKFGYGLKYLGTGGGNDNALALFSDNQQSTQIKAVEIKQDGTISLAVTPNVNGTNVSLVGHTHNYAGSSSAGGAATSANKLNTNAGSATNPVYFANGVPVACTYSLNKTVPADAVFTDTTYSANNGVGLSGTTFYNSGVRAATINGNYLRINTNGTNADLTIPYATNAGTASKLGSSTVGSSSRPIYLNSGSATAVDALDHSYVAFTGRNLSGSTSVLDKCFEDRLKCNSLAAIVASNVTIERSTDGGSTWTDAGYTDADKLKLFRTEAALKVVGSGSATTSNQLRITINTERGSQYINFTHLLIYLSTNGAAMKCEVSTAPFSAPTTFTVLSDVGVSGWTGWNSMNATITAGGYSGDTRDFSKYIRFRFYITGTSTQYDNNFSIISIRGLGGWDALNKNNLAYWGRVYNYDQNLNTSFPAQVSATSFKENGTALSSKYLGINANAVSATKLATARTIWGQSFDGSANVSGNMTGVGIINAHYHFPDASSNAHLFVTTNSASTDYIALQVSNGNGSNPSLRPLVLQPSSGNVGIGTTQPSEKLHVVGNILSSGNIIANGGVAAKGIASMSMSGGGGAAGAVTQINVGTTSYTPTDGIVTLPSSYPASDVSAWAKASIRPAYTTNLAATSSAASLTLAFGSKYNLSAGDTSFIFGMPSLPSATTGQAGIAQLSSAVDSTSETLAATAKAVKTAYDLADGKANAKLNFSTSTASSLTMQAAVQSTYVLWYTSSATSVTLAQASGTIGNAYGDIVHYMLFRNNGTSPLTITMSKYNNSNYYLIAPAKSFVVPANSSVEISYVHLISGAARYTVVTIGDVMSDIS